MLQTHITYYAYACVHYYICNSFGLRCRATAARQSLIMMIIFAPRPCAAMEREAGARASLHCVITIRNRKSILNIIAQLRKVSVADANDPRGKGTGGGGGAQWSEKQF